MAGLSMTMFKVDNLVSNLKELQQEKSCLEQKLNELRAKRRNLEMILETVNAKHAHVRATNAKMTETLKVAQHKVAQTQTQANSLESSNIQKRTTISELNEKIEKEQESQLDQVQNFEKELRAVSSNLNEAKHFFTEDNLEAEISGADKEISDAESKVDESKVEVDVLGEELNKLSLKHSGHGDTDVYGDSLEGRNQLWKMLQDENHSSLNCLDTLENNLRELTGRLQKERSEGMDDETTAEKMP